MLRTIIDNPQQLDIAIDNFKNNSNNIIQSRQKIDKLLTGKTFPQNNSKEYMLYFTLGSYPKDIGNKIVTCVDLMKSLGYNPKIIIKADGLDFTYDDFELFMDLEEKKKDDVEIFLSEDGNFYSVDQSLEAYLKCREYVDYINSKEASPFEKYLMIYRFVTSRVYTIEKDGKFGTSRDLISVLNNEEIVCVGYAKLLDYICNRVGIKSELQLLDVYDKSTGKQEGRHINNLIYIKDDKYGLDGYYLADSCWDSVAKNKEPYKNYLYSVVPLSDVSKICHDGLIFDTTNAFYNNYDKTSLSFDDNNFQGCKDVLNIKPEIPSLFDAYGWNGLLKKINSSSLELESLFRKNGIPEDFYQKGKYEKIPQKYDTEFLLSLLMSNPSEKEKVEQIVKEIKKFVANGGHIIDKKALKYNLTYASCDKETYHEKLKNIREGHYESTVLDRIEEYYENYKVAGILEEELNKIKENSKPINAEKFYEALTQSFLAEGYDEQKVAKISKQIMEDNYKYGQEAYENNACNCFCVDFNKTSMLEE